MAEPLGWLLKARIVARTIRNLVTRRPLCASFEVTHNCTANCRHCDKGEELDDHQVGPDEYGRICRSLRPVLAQVAGGEPLRRDDLPEVIRALHRPGRPPFIAVITNGSLLTQEKYEILRESGAHQFSISIDFPDSRHDDWRRIPGLFDHLSDVVPRLVSLGHGDVVMNCCMTRENYSEILEIARLTRSWGVKLNFSTYTALRTGNTELNLRHPRDTQRLDELIDELYSGRPEYSSIMTSERVMRRYSAFYRTCEVPGCRAGHRFLVVNPDGLLTPCAMHIERRFATRRELIKGFTSGNRCGGCYISSRANTEKSAWELLTDNLRFSRLSRSSSRAGA
ncbi:radical SAM protein [Candidatus Fermentibacterales bacterium]|nr:radical SAM protein [Candidatus Fermentibacterales bacterium]